jgi:hypothetical protein
MMPFNSKIGWRWPRPASAVPVRLRRSAVRFLRVGRIILIAGALFLSIPTLLARLHNSGGTVGHAQAPPPSSGKDLVKSFGELPLTFEQNQGQLNREIKFLSRGAGCDIYLTSKETILSLRKPSPTPNEAFIGDDHSTARKSRPHHQVRSPTSTSHEVIKMILVGGNAAGVSGLEESPGSVSYFLGKDPQKWRMNVRTFGRVFYKNVYPGIDQVFYGAGRELEYDFIVSPGANPRAVKFAFGGLQALSIDQGDLVLRTKGSEEVRLKKPFAYQEAEGGRRQPVLARYVIKPGKQVGFETGEYDASKPLIIDPVLSYSTYLGGSGNEAGYDVAVDAGGNAYVTGSTNSAEFSSLGGSNAFVAKLNPEGTARTYLAIIGGGGDDTGYSIAVDSAGNAYVAGTTDSTDFPVLNASQLNYGGGSQDAFVAKLNPTGSALTYSTYFGGTGNDSGLSIAVDSAGSAYTTGSTDSAEFSTLGNTNAFVAKLNAAGNERAYLAILGGGGDETGFDVAVDAAGSAYVVGTTDSTNFTTANAYQPVFGGAQDVFLAKLNPSGSSLVYATYFGGSGNDTGFGVAVDGVGNAYVAGSSDSVEFTALGGRDVFVAKFSPAGNERRYFTILGGSGEDAAFAIAVDASGNAYVTGSTDSGNFTTSNPLQQTSGGSQDVFISKLSPEGSTLDYSTFLGSGGNESGFAVALDNSGGTYVSGSTSSDSFPTASPLQPVSGGNRDSFILKISGSAPSIADPGFFVRQHYIDFLNREPDPGGLAFWTGEITSCGSDQACIEVKRINVSAAYFLSIEFQQTGYLVYRMYKAAFGNLPNAPVPVRLSEFLPDTRQIGQGVIVGQTGWEQQLENNKQAFALDFVTRSRFTSAYAATMTPAQFVDVLFANAGVAASAADRTAAINEFAGAGNSADAAARSRVLRRVAENSLLAQQEKNKAFVLMQYFGYLRRNPDDLPDHDFSGWQFWLTKLNDFNGNFIQAEMVKAFLNSTEYKNRFGQ